MHIGKVVSQWFRSAQPSAKPDWSLLSGFKRGRVTEDCETTARHCETSLPRRGGASVTNSNGGRATDCKGGPTTAELILRKVPCVAHLPHYIG